MKGGRGSVRWSAGSMSGTDQHRMARIAQENDAMRGVDPFLERLAIHESPFEGRLDEAQNLAYPIKR